MGKTINVLLVLDVARSAETGEAVVRHFDDNLARGSRFAPGVHCRVGDTLVWSAVGRVPTWGVAVPRVDLEEGDPVFGDGPEVDPRTGTWRARIDAPGEALCRFVLAANGADAAFEWDLSIHAEPAEREPARVRVGFIARPS